MTYEVLARKYRPRKFTEVVGQESTIRVLANALESQRLHHAYLFTGTRGVGKTTIARLLAAALNCQAGISSNPCGDCVACTEIRKGTFVDLMEVDAASRTGVDDTRMLLENMQFGPVVGRFKVYLIDEVHMLSTSSFNALLKTLEEPPTYAQFIFATTDPRKIPVTVLSRCMQFMLRNISQDTIVGKLSEVLAAEGITCDEDVLVPIGKAADGSMRDALSLTDQAIAFAGGSHVTLDLVLQMLGVARGEDVVGLLAAVVRQNREEVFRRSGEFATVLTNLEDVMASMQSLCHEVAMDWATDSETRRELSEIREFATPEWLQSAYQILLMGMRDLSFAPDPQVGFEMTLIRMLDFEPLLPAEENASGLENGEKSPVHSESMQSMPAKRKKPRIRPDDSRSKPDPDQKSSATTEALFSEEQEQVRARFEQHPQVDALLKKFGGKIAAVGRTEPAGPGETELQTAGEKREGAHR